MTKAPRSAEKIYNDLLNNARKRLQPVAQNTAKEFDKVTSKMTRNKPIWKGQAWRDGDILAIQVILVNDTQQIISKNGKKYGGTVKDLILWLFKTGTKEHDIPKTPGKIFYLKGKYARKFQLGGGFGSGKVAGGTLRQASQVTHPGFQPAPHLKQLEENLDRDLEDDFDDALGSAMRIVEK
jgi:hypothetical protein